MAEDPTNSNPPDSVPTTGDGSTPTPTAGDGSTPTPTTGDGSTPTPTTGDGSTPSSETQAVPASVLATGRALVALLTLIIAGATLYLTFRSDDRDTAEAQDRERLYAKQVGFYRTGDQAAVANGSTHFMPMRLVLPSKHVWWDLQGPEPCKQVWIPFSFLIAGMHEKLPNLPLSEDDLADLQLRFQDPAGRAWSIDRTGALSATTWTASTGEEGTQLDRSDLLLYPDEPWMTKAQISAGCGPS